MPAIAVAIACAAIAQSRAHTADAAIVNCATDATLDSEEKAFLALNNNHSSSATPSRPRDQSDNANMLSTSYSAIGIGRAYTAGSPYSWYWTTEFGGVNDGWSSIEAPAAGPSPTPEPATTDARLILRARAGGSLHLRVDTGGTRGIVRVEFYVDATIVGTDTRAPFATTLRATGQGGRQEAHALVYDRAGSVTRLDATAPLDIDSSHFHGEILYSLQPQRTHTTFTSETAASPIPRRSRDAGA